MNPHYLERFFSPRSIAVIGATDREGSVGRQILENLIQASFQGELYPVNPKHDELLGLRCYPEVGAIGAQVDLAVIVTPAKTLPSLVRACGEEDIRSALVISAGFSEIGAAGEHLQAQMLEEARRAGVRLMGPNCLGFMRPSLGLNATFSKGVALPGHLALVSQSGALCTSILDWAQESGVGFSTVASLGDLADVGFGEVLEYLALDPDTHSILLYIEGVRHTRRFMSGLRTAARLKPVIVIKVGRHKQGALAAHSHTGSLVGMDDVFDAALERAGVVRVFSIDQLFSTAQLLASGHRVRGGRLGIVTNGGGPGVMVTDRAVDLGVELSSLSEKTLDKLNALLPAHWSHNNPVDILGDAAPSVYQDVVSVCLQDEKIDGLLVMLAPQAMTAPSEAAQAVVDAIEKQKKPVLTSWMGGAQVAEGRAIFAKHHVPHFSSPEAAVEAFSSLARYHHNQALLLQTPGPLSDARPPDVEGARLIIEGALAQGRKQLNQIESKAILRAFHIPTVQAIEAKSPHEALVVAETLGFPVAMKVQSDAILHKTDVGGVRLGIRDAAQVRSTFNELMAEVQLHRPEAKIDGVIIEQMVHSSSSREVMVGVVRDQVFGPAISFGMGGVYVEVLRDRAIALPPLNVFLIQRMIERTKASKLLGEFRGQPAANMEALEGVLLRVSEMVCELPWIVEMDINPLFVDADGAVALDARIIVERLSVLPRRYGHMALHPYPSHLIKRLQLTCGTNLTIRPIRPEDAKIELEFVRGLSAESRYFRFMHALQELSTRDLVRFTQLDYDREMALIAVLDQDGEGEVEVGVARYSINADGQSCDFALVVADAWQGKGLGSRLMHELIEAARARGLAEMRGDILSDNHNMLKLVRSLGFSCRLNEEDATLQRAALVLRGE
ncbi:MAG: bifunctional acetate--CoA ligase family protein/GNAT family N-acetyltransferase [Myxococcales bacterium]|nr:bifunctional acetate--CoA ligase family protein/GNAT family N-acetyltransferase [Myxococcales bacterium]